MKRDYMRPYLARVDMMAESIILDGSYTNKAIKVQTVTVDDFDNGFDPTIAPDGFKEIEFD